VLVLVLPRDGLGVGRAGCTSAAVLAARDMRPVTRSAWRVVAFALLTYCSVDVLLADLTPAHRAIHDVLVAA